MRGPGVIAVLLLARLAAAAPDVALFDPDANLANVARLRSTVGTFVRTIDDEGRFEAFGKILDLKNHLAGRRAQFVLLNTLYVPELKGIDLRPVLIPLREGGTTYHKVLLVRRGTSADTVRIVATTSPPTEVAAIHIGDRSFEDALVLHVTKGLDALLGMALGRVDAAYVTPQTVRALAGVDPELAASLVEIYRSPAIPNPQLYVVGEVAPTLVGSVVDAFLKMNRTPEGRAVLRILDYTGWRTP